MRTCSSQFTCRCLPRRAMDNWLHERLADERVPMRTIQDAADTPAWSDERQIARRPNRALQPSTARTW
jgi:hypothetical protein